MQDKIKVYSRTQIFLSEVFKFQYWRQDPINTVVDGIIVANY